RHADVDAVFVVADVAAEVSVGSVVPRGVLVPPAIDDDGVNVSVPLLSTGFGTTVSVPVAVAVPGVVAEFDAVSVYVQTMSSVMSVAGALIVIEVPRSAGASAAPVDLVTFPVPQPAAPPMASATVVTDAAADVRAGSVTWMVVTWPPVIEVGFR